MNTNKQFSSRTRRYDITEEIIQKFANGVKRHLLGTHNKKISISKAFRLTLYDEFCVEVETLEGGKKWVLPDKLPSEHQFRAFLQKSYIWDKRHHSRMTAAGFGASVRSRLSETRTLAPSGPGDIYQIKSTEVDMYIVSESGKRKVLCRVTLYLVAECWSRCIIGFHLTRGSSTYKEAVLALLSALDEKEAMCKRFEVPYAPEDWGAMPLPATLIVDHQECTYGNSNLLAEKLGIWVSNPPPYQGEYKCLVEDAMGATMEILRSAFGAADKKSAKDDKDCPLNSIFTFTQFRRMLFLEVIRLNRRHPGEIPVPRKVVLAGIPKVPVKLAQSGLQNISGCGLSANVDEVRRALLPTQTSRAQSRNPSFGSGRHDTPEQPE